MLVVGNVIGAGIFTTAGFLAGEVSSPWLFASIWIFGGLITLCGALTYAEMAGMFPRSGGDYLFLKAAYGSWAGFLLGWISFWVINPGSIAVLSISLVKYLTIFSGSCGIVSEKVIAAGIVAVFSLINLRGVRLTGTVQNIWTSAGLAIIIFFIIGGIISGKGDWSNFSGPITGAFFMPELFGPAMIAVIFSYSGWFITAYIGDELKQPTRNLPLSLLIGTFIVMILYTAINVVYVYALPIAKIKGVIDVGQVAGQKLLGANTSQIVSLAIILVIGASINATTLAGARLTYATARDEVFLPYFKKLHPGYGTPHTAIIVQGCLAGIYIFFETFENLLGSVVFVMLLSSIGSGLAHLILRFKKPDMERPYRTWGYPYIPLFFVAAYICIAVQILLDAPIKAMLGVVITVSGIPFYLYSVRGTESKRFADTAVLFVQKTDQKALD